MAGDGSFHCCCGSDGCGARRSLNGSLIFFVVVGIGVCDKERDYCCLNVFIFVFRGVILVDEDGAFGCGVLESGGIVL